MRVTAEFRTRAAEQSRKAEQTRNPMARLMHKKAAERWTAYADEPDCLATQRTMLVRQQRAFSV